MLRDHWYIGCASSRLGEAPVRVTIMDRALVLFRDASGKPQALLDRCCHRGYRLSCGKVVGDTVQCGFHGWQFDGSGACVHIPSLREGANIPKAFTVPRHPCVEVDGYVWVWMAKDVPEPSYLPSIPEFAGGEWVQGCVPMACGVLQAIEIGLDGQHVYFVHPTLPATVEWNAKGGVFHEGGGEIRRTDTGFVYFWPPTESASDPIPKDAAKIVFQLPNLVRVETTHGGKTYHVIMYLVPTGERSCRLEYLTPQFRPTGVKVKWAEEVPDIFAEDKHVLEITQLAADEAAGSFVERSVEADAPPLMARHIFKMLEKEDWRAVREKIVQRKTFLTRK